MDRLVKHLEDYLSEITGLDINVHPMERSDLPYYFSRQYRLYRLKIGNTTLTAVILQEEDEFKPAQFIKQIRQELPLETDEICVVAQMLPSYVRKRLIERGVSFVIPKVQMYLPGLGMELRPRSERRRPVAVERFSPATQVVLIHCLLGRIHGSVTPLELSKQLHYSSMTMSRALNELEHMKIAKVERSGKERLLTFIEDRQVIWQQALPHLRNPINHTVRILEENLRQEDILPAGITVLSNLSMLNEPDYPEYAISRNGWKVMNEMGVEKIPIEEPGTCLLQVWCYSPKVLEVDGHVDPFSLYLSLHNENDERVQMALEEMMERYAL